jgi:hypothetical protein
MVTFHLGLVPYKPKISVVPSTREWIRRWSGVLLMNCKSIPASSSTVASSPRIPSGGWPYELIQYRCQ